MEKKKAINITIISVTAVIIMAIVILLTLYYNLREVPYTIKPIDMPISEISALETYDKESLNDVKLTMRSDIMKVTKRNIKRPETKLLADEFTLPGTTKTVTFPSYPGYYIYHDIKSDYESTNQYTYYKYMLLRQGMYLLDEAKNDCLNGSITQETLFKHPAADAQFGEVIGDAVEKEIIVDPTYRSLHTTGLYLPAGELIKIDISGLKASERVGITINRQSGLGYSSGMPSNYFEATDLLVKEGKFDEIQISNQWNKLNNRLPFIQTNIQFNSNNTFYYGNPFGGIIHLDVSGLRNPVKITISGAVETPHFILGVTDVDYFNEYLVNAPGVLASLDVENGVMIGPANPMRQVDDIENVALLWHSYFAVNENFTGGPYNANNLVLFDAHVPAGAAVHLGGGVSVCPSGWFNGCMSYESLLRKGTWGVLHEVGHGNASSYGTTFGLGGSQEGEVRNNILICLAYLKFGDMGTYHGEGVEHGFVTHPYTNLESSLNISNSVTDYNQLGYFDALSCYVNLMHSFGVDKFYELLYTYKTNPKYVENKRADFAYRCALVYNQNFLYYFNDLYKCNIKEDMLNEEQIKFIKSKKTYIPIANFYAGGIDGVKTGGDNIVTQGIDLEMDLLGKMKSSKPITKIEISNPEHGRLVKNESGTYTYKTNEKYYTSDKFNIYAKQENGIYHTLTVYLRINLSKANVKRYYNIGTRDLDIAVKRTVTLSPDLEFDSLVAGVANYTTANGQGNIFNIAKFNYLAKSDGEYSFYLKCDDLGELQFSDDLINYYPKIRINSYTSNYSESNKFTVTLQKGKVYGFKVLNINTGGQGNALVGVKYKTNNINNINRSELISPDAKKEEIEQYINFNPIPNKFYTSKKDNIISGIVGTNKQEWEILLAPNRQGGNTYIDKQYDEEGNIIAEIEKNYSSVLIDGFTNTIYHSVYSGGNRTPIPHEFIIDTKLIQPFNFFKIYTRNNVNSYIKKFDLQMSLDNITYKSIVSGNDLEYKNLCATLRFKEIKARYLKLIVYKTTGHQNGDYFTVISELDAGVTASTEKIVPVKSSKLFTTEKFLSIGALEELPSDSIYTKEKDQKLVIKFTGPRISLYATKNIGYGSAKVYIDGTRQADINLNSDALSYKNLVFAREGLSDGEHTLEIITDTSEVFNLEFIGLSFLGSLLNAPNIYTERVMTITIIVFVILFVLAITFILLAYFVPPFRKFFFRESFLKKIDSKFDEKKKRKQKSNKKRIVNKQK